MRKNTKKGFTIVELVIVIAVIGILSAILIPTFVNASNNAKAAALQSNLRNAYIEYSTVASESDADEIELVDHVYISTEEISDTTDLTKVKVYELSATETGKWVEVDTETVVTKYKKLHQVGEYKIYTYQA